VTWNALNAALQLNDEIPYEEQLIEHIELLEKDDRRPGAYFANPRTIHLLRKTLGRRGEKLTAPGGAAYAQVYGVWLVPSVFAPRGVFFPVREWPPATKLSRQECPLCGAEYE
jgi:hypothetical protein